MPFQARELSSLTGADVLLIISSEMSNVYDFSTPKFHGVLAKCKVYSRLESNNEE